jgi:hypothetical protein
VLIVTEEELTKILGGTENEVEVISPLISDCLQLEVKQ